MINEKKNHYKGYNVASASNDPDLKNERKKTKPKCDPFGRRELYSIPYTDLHMIVHSYQYIALQSYT